MALQEKLDTIREASRTRIPPDAQAIMRRSIDELAVVSPQVARTPRETEEPKPLSFELLRDFGNRVAEAYGLAFTLPDDLREIYLKFGIDLAKGNGDGTWRLPVPARFVIDGQGIIRAVDADPDYTRRSEPARTVEILQGLRATTSAKEGS
ncbi:MAG: hypothetical protein ACREK9_14390 [Candidatus Rokuibacteriota bacterium]